MVIEIPAVFDGKRWIRKDGKECSICQNSLSSSYELFLCNYENGDKMLYCSICLSEYPLSNEPECIKLIERVI